MQDPQIKLSRPRKAIPAKPGGADVREMPGRKDIDAALVASIVEREDKSALQDIAGHYGPRLKSFLMKRGEQPQTAEDIVQDVIIQVWLKASKYDVTRGSFSTWLYRMTRNKWIDHKRKHGRMQPMEPSIIGAMQDDFVDGADIEYDRNESAVAVRRQMALLPTEQKQILQLAFFEGLSHSQISNRTGLALGTVKSRIRISLKKMQGGLEDFRNMDQ